MVLTYARADCRFELPQTLHPLMKAVVAKASRAFELAPLDPCERKSLQEEMEEEYSCFPAVR